MSKYVEPLQGSASQEKVFLGSSKGSIEVEVVGLDKVRGRLANLQLLKEVSLDGENVAGADPPGELHRSCPSELCMIVIYLYVFT
jgi:tubulin-specific chaperone E